MSRLKSGLRKIRRLIQGGLVKMRYKNDLKAHSDLSIYIDLDEIVFERYFYLFVKFFHLEGYTVYFKPNLIALAGLKESEYANYLLLEKILHFRNHPETHQLIISNTEGGVSLSADYFTNLLKKRLPNSDYYVPMAMHPNMYYEKLWDIEYQFEKKQCVFFAGNFDREAYLAIKKQSVFKVLDRITIYDTLKKNFEVHIPKEFEDSQEREADKEVVIIDRDYCAVPIPVLRETLARYAFFLACPGIVMPFSHNITEAMSVGSIPLIESQYAEMFIPNLQDGVNAIVFDGSASLVENIKRIFALEKSDVLQMSLNVKAYYEAHLTPKNVVCQIISNQYNKLYLQAEYYSVNLYRGI